MSTTTLYTPYESSFNKEAPHSYYPRPSLRRESYISLNGEWDFATFGRGGTPDYKEKITVPFCPESRLSGICQNIKKGALIAYRRTVTVPVGFIKDRVLLHFGAVDGEYTLYINGKPSSQGAEGYLPFTQDVTGLIVEGENTVEITVLDTLSHDLPYGKQKRRRGGMWYTPVSGIWQSVWLESVVDRYVKKIYFTPDDRGVTAMVDGCTEGVFKLDNGEEFALRDGIARIEPKDIRYWSPEEPNLYSYELRAGEDKVCGYFAIRTVGVVEFDGKKRLTLNGKPYLFNGLLDQGYYPEGIYTPATVEGFVNDIKAAKAAGFNMLRKHIKIEPEIFYYLCDTMGIAVFQDMVNNGGYSFIKDTALPTIGMQRVSDRFMNLSPVRRRIFIDHMLKTADHLYSHPSVVYYTIFNEGWGQFCADKAYDLLKKKDSTRIIDSTSGWFRRYRTDVDSRHIYFKRLNVDWDGKMPLVISEFGGYSHRVAGHLFSENNYGYRNFENASEYESAVLDLYRNEVMPLIELGASAFVYTQLSDVEDETNGILTYDRQIEKLDFEKCKKTMDILKQSYM